MTSPAQNLLGYDINDDVVLLFTCIPESTKTANNPAGTPTTPTGSTSFIFVLVDPNLAVTAIDYPGVAALGGVTVSLVAQGVFQVRITGLIVGSIPASARRYAWHQASFGAAKGGSQGTFTVIDPNPVSPALLIPPP